MKSVVCYCYLESPLGTLLAASEGELLTRLYLPNHKGASEPESDWRQSDAPFDGVRSQLAEYFAGRREVFDVPLKLTGSPFQQQVWQELVRIPYGGTISYAELARRVGNPRASRAVGRANGRNPISIIVPCHRVIGSSGRLTGYAGGLDNKRWLLDWEQRHQRLEPASAAGAATVDSRSPNSAARSDRS